QACLTCGFFLPPHRVTTSHAQCCPWLFYFPLFVNFIGKMPSVRGNGRYSRRRLTQPSTTKPRVLFTRGFFVAGFYL
ncbi:MAG: hypothetical protein KC423_00005, partial [Anaerolineales bacterium]|nr:hypothetical protein [Anaerolineales bacterium]